MIYPKFYHGRTKDNSDREFIFARLAFIPAKYHQRVSDKYEKLYRSLATGNRKSANTYIHKVAKRFRYATNKSK